MKCRICKRELKNPEAIAKGIGHICAMKNRVETSEAKKPRVLFQFKFADGARSYVVLTSPVRIVRIIPTTDGGREARCTCETFYRGEKCEHITLAADADAARFLQPLAA